MNGDATILNQQPDESRYFGGCTNWAQYSVAQLKYALEEDHQLAWNQVSAWSRTSLLIGEYREIMTQVRDRVASAWNAPPGSAAHEFLTFIDGLISAMIHVEATAVANKSALANLLTTLATTRTRITDLQQQWQKNQDMDDAARASLLEYLPRPPAHWKQDLSNQAMEHMHHMDQQVFSATRLMVVPPLPGSFPEFVAAAEPGQPSSRGTGGLVPRAPHVPPPQIMPPIVSEDGQPDSDSNGSGGIILDEA